MGMRTTTIAAALTAFALALTAPGAQAQTRPQRDARHVVHERSAPSAAQVAAEVQAFYDQTRTVRTAFYQSHYDRLYRRTTRSRGVLTVMRPGKMRFDYLGGDGKVIVTDGRTLTVYEPGEHGPGQYMRTRLEEGLPSALGFIAGTARLDRDFRFRLRDASRFRFDGHVLELRPRVQEPGYRRVFLFVDAGATRGVVRRVLVQDHDGNLNRFDFRRTRFNRPVSERRFSFRPPRGARRIQSL